jgi:hypothetical protein
LSFCYLFYLPHSTRLPAHHKEDEEDGDKDENEDEDEDEDKDEDEDEDEDKDKDKDKDEDEDKDKDEDKDEDEKKDERTFLFPLVLPSAFSLLPPPSSPSSLLLIFIQIVSAEKAQAKRGEESLVSGSKYNVDPTWANGLISAAQSVAGSVKTLVVASNASVEGKGREEEGRGRSEGREDEGKKGGRKNEKRKGGRKKGE